MGNDFSMFPKLNKEEMNKYYNFSNTDKLPMASFSQLKYIHLLLDKNDLDTDMVYNITGKNIKELNINEASKCIEALKKIK